MSALFLTGATGMVGRELLARVARDPRWDSVFCLVRGGKDGPSTSGGSPAEQRLDALADKLGLPADAKARLVAVDGDVSAPGLGLSAIDRERLADVTRAIHCAATVTFDHPLDEARKINVDGTREVVALCRSLRHLERLDAVSTCYVAGRRDGLVLERELEHDRGFHNTYEQTKYESEQLLRAAMVDLPIAVHRPSIVVGDSRTGKTGAWKVLYWPLKVIARGWLPVVPFDAEGRLDIVPVDFVADGILALADQPASIGRTVHLAAGPARDTTMAELTSRVFAKMGRRAPLRVSPKWFRRVVRPALMVAPSKGIRRTLTNGVVYRPYLELRLQFDTTEADALLGEAGVRCPAVVDYIDTIVDEALRTDFGARA